MARRVVNSMFHRRLLLIGGLLTVALAGLIAQLARLSIARGEESLRTAEARLVRENWTPTVRGRILDRKGAILARPAPGYDIAVDYRVLSGSWAREQATAYAKKAHADLWGRLAFEQRAELIARYQPAFEDHLAQMWPRLAAESGSDTARLLARREQIIERVERIQEGFLRRQLGAAENAALERGRELTDAAIAQISRSSQVAERVTPHAVISNVPDAVALGVGRLIASTTTLFPAGRGGAPVTVPTFPGLALLETSRRDYPFETMSVDVSLAAFPGPLRAQRSETVEVRGVATHILGWLRGTQAEDIARRSLRLETDPVFRAEALTPSGIDRAAYFPDDECGATGIEASMEPYLRGLRGLSTLRLDTDAREVLPASPGLDITLTIDIELQARVQAAMDPALGLAQVQEWHGKENDFMPAGTPLSGAAVVLDIDSGEILAMVSTPSFTRDELAADPARIYADPIDAPWVNRCINKPYPPGSIAKAPLLCEASLLGAYHTGETIRCTGHLYESAPDAFRCWIYKSFGVTHNDVLQHDLNAVEALTVSCNIFFYSLGRRLGPEGITTAYTDLGVGTPLNLGIGEEFSGAIGTLGRSTPLTIQDATFMGIGQGPVAWTPLHAANAFATLARGGRSIPPRIVRGIAEPASIPSLVYNPADVRAALDGLEHAVGDRLGTGNHLTFADGSQEPVFSPPPGVRIWGKTGTAQAPHIMIDPDGPDGPAAPIIARAGDHSWFVVMVGRDRPRYVISVLMEYAGSGGRVSGPIVNQIIQALAAEGYF